MYFSLFLNVSTFIEISVKKKTTVTTEQKRKVNTVYQQNMQKHSNFFIQILQQPLRALTAHPLIQCVMHIRHRRQLRPKKTPPSRRECVKSVCITSS